MRWVAVLLRVAVLGFCAVPVVWAVQEIRACIAWQESEALRVAKQVPAEFVEWVGRKRRPDAPNPGLG